MFALTQNTLKITVGLGVGALSVSGWCVLVCVLLCLVSVLVYVVVLCCVCVVCVVCCVLCVLLWWWLWMWLWWWLWMWLCVCVRFFLSCTEKRFRVYVQNASVCTFKTPASHWTRAF